tara:strand:- start:8103 stop:9182 length:1080 start_codon:yes stop_codon:yes gene_type:complete
MIRVFKNFLIFLISLLLILTILNSFFIWFSPVIVNNLSINLVNKIDKCYRTFYHTNLEKNYEHSKFTLVMGDSHSEGMGDEFLSNQKNYGLINKIDTEKNLQEYLIFGRSGYGNISAYYELNHCFYFLNKFTSLNLSKKNVNFIDFIFYEGNDLNNNLAEFDKFKITNDRLNKRKIMFFVPLFNLILSIPELIKTSKIFLNKNEIKDINIVASEKVTIPLPQSAATELNDGQLIKSLEIFATSILKTKKLFPKSEINLLYLPSVATSYPFQGKIKVQSYKGKHFFNTTSDFNNKRSQLIRLKIEQFCNTDNNCNFCDSTKKLQETVISEGPIHGPIDWKHLNKIGYESLSKVYNVCFNN